MKKRFFQSNNVRDEWLLQLTEMSVIYLVASVI